jgi:hypothetical protein
VNREALQFWMSDNPVTPVQQTGPAKRPLTVSLIAVLLLGQWLGFWGLAAYYVVRFRQQLAAGGMLGVDIPQALRGPAFGALGLLALLAALGFWRVWPAAWMSAIAVQGAGLLLSLGLYFRDRPFYVYIILLNNIWMVIHLNFAEVLEAFGAERQVTDWGGLNER